MATKGKFPSNLFKGKETMSEELKEAKAIKSGKITPMQYAKGEKMEESKKKPFKRRFADGGEVTEYLPRSSSKFSREEEETANNMVAAGESEPDPIKNMADLAESKDRFESKPKRSIVTKEELEKSGLSLRDYMNKQQGLKRRDGSAPETKTPSYTRKMGATADGRAEYEASPEGQYRKADAEARTPDRKAARAAQAEADAPENMSADLIGGPWKLAAGAAAAGLGALGLRHLMKGGAKKAAESGGRAVATKLDDIEFLGRSGARKMGSETARIGADDAGKAITNNPTPRLSGPSKQLSAPVKAADDEVSSVVAARQAARDKVVTDKDLWAKGPTAMNTKAQKLAEKGAAPKKPRAIKKKVDEDISKADTLGPEDAFKRGGSVKKFAAGGSVKGWGAARSAKSVKCY